MISDVRAEMVDGIDHSLGTSTFDNVYQSKLRARVVELREMALVMRVELDTPPSRSDDLAAALCSTSRPTLQEAAEIVVDLAEQNVIEPEEEDDREEEARQLEAIAIVRAHFWLTEEEKDAIKAAEGKPS